MIATICMCSLDFDECYINHYIKHYNSQGIDYHFLILHSKEKVDEDLFKEKYSYPNVFIFFIYGIWNTVVSQTNRHYILKRIGVSKNDWIINSDIDEHAEASGKSLKEKILEMELNGENCCLGIMTDRIAEDGSLPNICEEKSLSEQFPLVVNFGRAVLKCQTRKIPITRGDINVLGGSHNVVPDDEKRAIYNSEVIVVNHYKWAGKVKEKLEERVKTHKAFFHWRESERFLRYWNRFKTLKPQRTQQII